MNETFFARYKMKIIREWFRSDIKIQLFEIHGILDKHESYVRWSVFRAIGDYNFEPLAYI